MNNNNYKKQKELKYGIPSNIRWKIDYDYAHTLSDYDYMYLLQFTEEYYDASFDDEDSLHDTEELRRSVYNQKNSSNRDLSSICTASLIYGDEANFAIDQQMRNGIIRPKREPRKKKAVVSSKAGPVKTFSAEERQALALKMGIKS